MNNCIITGISRVSGNVDVNLRSASFAAPGMGRFAIICEISIHRDLYDTVFC